MSKLSNDFNCGGSFRLLNASAQPCLYYFPRNHLPCEHTQNEPDNEMQSLEKDIKSIKYHTTSKTAEARLVEGTQMSSVEPKRFRMVI